MYENSALAHQGQAATCRTTEVQGAQEVLLKSCEELGMVAADLESRLHPVLAQRAEDAQKEPSQPQPLRVPVAQAIYDRSAQVYGVTKALRSILDRLEV